MRTLIAKTIIEIRAKRDLTAAELEDLSDKVEAALDDISFEDIVKQKLKEHGAAALTEVTIEEV